MCCVIYYVYLKMRNYFNKPRKKDEALYNARQLNEYVRKKERTYWTSYSSCYD